MYGECPCSSGSSVSESEETSQGESLESKSSKLVSRRPQSSIASLRAAEFSCVIACNA
jgi:hypothetical protein